MNALWRCAIAMLVGIVLVAPTAAPAQDTIKVGIVLPLTGDQAKFGEIEKQSFDLALDKGQEARVPGGG
ncbi:MAG: hypothetical protein H6Q51_1858 [Deltaproteobacteria bacterium]|nr:hypothetical protein [Deltaproteobacteria bacterium]